MKNIMKKLTLTAALGCACFTGAFADATDNANGPFTVTVNDYILMTPNGTFPQGQPTIVFTNAGQMVSGVSTGTQTFTIDASRSWKVKLFATPFALDPGVAAGNDPSVTDAVNPETDNFYTQESKNGSAGVVTNGPNNFMAVQQQINGGLTVASSPFGGLGMTFDLTGKIQPNLATMNLQGTYTSQILILAALD